MRPRRKRCWYCRRTGWFGFKRDRQPWQAPECRNDNMCFHRARTNQTEGA